MTVHALRHVQIATLEAGHGHFRRFYSGLLFVGFVVSCAPPELVAVPPDWRVVNAGTWSFQFPQDRELLGLDDHCGGRSAPTQGCAIAIDSVFFGYDSPELSFRTKDSYGPDGPKRWGSRIRINGISAYQLTLDDGAQQYLLTDRAGGANAAVRFSWPTKEVGRINNPREQELMWVTCRTPRACETARAIFASARFQQRQ